MLERIDAYRTEGVLREQGWDLVAQAVAELRGTSGLLACILFDLDHFLQLLDSIGSEQGQQLLGLVLDELNNTLDTARIVSYGRDEMLVLVQVASIEDAIVRAETARQRISAKVRTYGGEQTLAVGCSAGLALFPTHAQDAIGLIGKAEEGLYCAKRAGRNCTKLPAQESMVLKSNYYSIIQLERLTNLARQTNRTEASLLREALDRFLRNYDL